MNLTRCAMSGRWGSIAALFFDIRGNVFTPRSSAFVGSASLDPTLLTARDVSLLTQTAPQLPLVVLWLLIACVRLTSLESLTTLPRA